MMTGTSSHPRLRTEGGGEGNAVHGAHLKVADDNVGDIVLALLQRLDGVGKALQVGAGHKGCGQARINPLVGDLVIDDGD